MLNFLFTEPTINQILIALVILLTVIFLAFFAGALMTWLGFREVTRDRRDLAQRFTGMRDKYETILQEKMSLELKVMDVTAKLNIALSRIDELSSQVNYYQERLDEQARLIEAMRKHIGEDCPNPGLIG